MSIYQPPLDPIVAQNGFREKVYEHVPIPLFIEIKDQLPEPFFVDKPEWVQMYWRAWELAWSNLQRPSTTSNFISNYITRPNLDHIYFWDSAFMVLFGVYGRSAFDFIGTLDNFYAKQHKDGFICRQIDQELGHDFFAPHDPNGTGPNILAWAEWRYFRGSGDDGRLSKVFWPLLAYHNWCREHRTWPNGAYWATGMSSGMDNQPRVPDSRHHHRHWSWVDATMQASLDCVVLGLMASHLGEEEHANALNSERHSLLQLVNDHFWNHELKFYQDVDVNGRFSRVKTIGAFWGLLDRGLVADDNLSDFVQSLRENWAFKMPHRLPSLSADSDGYNAAGNLWRGSVWPNANYFVLKGLRNVGKHNLAHEIAVNHLNTVCEVYQKTDTIWEYYSPEAAEPGEGATPNVVGMSGLTPISILLEDVLGLNTDWPRRRVIWDRRLDLQGDYGVHNYALGSDGTLDLVNHGDKVVITTDTTFTLTIQMPDENIQTAVSSGTTEIDLS